tara:strand:- start:43 stop:261 length:219 start_codon:yes stop_codon:yes gene_type:complete
LGGQLRGLQLGEQGLSNSEASAIDGPQVYVTGLLLLIIGHRVDPLTFTIVGWSAPVDPSERCGQRHAGGETV